MPRRQQISRIDQTTEAVILVDYANLFGIISERSRSNDQPDQIVLDLVQELRRHTSEHLQLNTRRTIAFANIPPGTSRGHRATGAWLAQGIEPSFTYAQGTDEATSIDLAVEAMDIAALAPGRLAFIILSGNHWYVSLVQRLQRAGHFVLMASLESPSRIDHLPADVIDSFLNARFLLSRGDSGSNGSPAVLAEESDDDSGSESHRPTDTAPVSDAGALRTLEIIDTYFGQYEEVYLTPLLRKLSDELEHHHEEPKTIINILEEAGAIWLEKRRGFPHNYTVLLVNGEHEDVQEVQAGRTSDSGGGAFDDEYYDEDYEDDLDDDLDHDLDEDSDDESYDDHDEYSVESEYEEPRD